MKKTDVKNISAGTKTTMTKPNGSKTIIYNGVSHLAIGRTFTYGVPSTSPVATSSNHNIGKQPSVMINSVPTVKAGVTFNKVDNLHLNSKEINKILSSKDHKTYGNLKNYYSSQSTSSKNQQPEQSCTSSFKR